MLNFSELDNLLSAATSSLSKRAKETIPIYEVLELTKQKTLVVPKKPEMKTSGAYMNTEDFVTKVVYSNPSIPIIEYKRPIPKELQLDKSKIKVLETTGSKWFDMPAPEITDEIKRDLHILKSRGVLDPKRHYKTDNTKGKLPKFFQFGTIIEGPADYYSSRLSKKARKDTIVEELLEDSQRTSYFKKKFLQSQEKKMKNAPLWLKKKIEKLNAKKKRF